MFVGVVLGLLGSFFRRGAALAASLAWLLVGAAVYLGLPTYGFGWGLLGFSIIAFIAAAGTRHW
jgi:hypothetical protein